MSVDKTVCRITDAQQQQVEMGRAAIAQSTFIGFVGRG
jgi:hypothetical protein